MDSTLTPAEQFAIDVEDTECVECHEGPVVALPTMRSDTVQTYCQSCGRNGKVTVKWS